MAGKIISINISEKEGVRKKPIKEVSLKNENGIKEDAHASSEWHRQEGIFVRVLSDGIMKEGDQITVTP